MLFQFVPAMRTHLKNLFWHRHHNNHKPKVLHLSSLTILILIVVAYQLVLTLFTKVRPGVLGFASHITSDEIVALTNDQRTVSGLAPLKTNSLLLQAAAAKANYMFAKDYWAHNGPNGTTPWFFFKQAGYNYRYAGENLARDFNQSDSVVVAWMNSPTHRDNIISDHYDEIGVAVVNGILGGQETTLVVQMFGQSTTGLAAISQSAVQTQNQVSGQTAVSEPMIAVVEQEAVQPSSLSKTTLSRVEAEYTENFPLFSAFTLTKSLNLALALLVMLVLAIDGWLVWQRKTIRISGKSFVHLSLFTLIVILIFLSENGQIL